MLRKSLYIYLRPYEDAIIFTSEGRMDKVFVHNDAELLSNADTIQGMISNVMKHREARTGRWVWKISERWQSFSGYEMDNYLR